MLFYSILSSLCVTSHFVKLESVAFCSRVLISLFLMVGMVLAVLMMSVCKVIKFCESYKKVGVVKK